MRNTTTPIVAAGLIGASAIGLPQPVAAQPAPTAARTVIAEGELPTVVGGPRYFRLARVTVPAEPPSKFEGPTAILYQVSGSTDVTLNGADKTLTVGQGLLLPEGTKAGLRARGSGPSTFLQFLLTTASQERSPETPPAATRELYRTQAPIPDLKSGVYEINLTRITFPPRMPSNPPHYRSGAALYYILSGTGANTIGGKVIVRSAGSIVYEPFGLVHQWANPGDAPLTFVAFDINPDHTSPVLRGVPAKP